MTGVEYLVSSKGFKPWGVVFKRRFVYDRGGGPVYYMRSDDWDLRDSVPLELRSRLIEFAPDKGVDWIEEREWRVVYREGEIGFEFEPDDVEAVVVGDADWREPGRPTSWTAPYSRWYWDGERLNQLS